MLSVLSLIVLGALTRLVPHPPNAVAIGALALYAGARLPRRWAVVVPLAAMALADLALDYGTRRDAITATRLTVYATFALIALLGRLPRADSGPMTRAGMSLLASTLFFLTSNFAVWATAGFYPGDAQGLATCYLAALPFFGNTLLADLAGTAALFGLDPLAHRVAVVGPAGARADA